MGVLLEKLMALVIELKHRLNSFTCKRRSTFSKSVLWLSLPCGRVTILWHVCDVSVRYGREQRCLSPLWEHVLPAASSLTLHSGHDISVMPLFNSSSRCCCWIGGNNSMCLVCREVSFTSQIWMMIVVFFWMRNYAYTLTLIKCNLLTCENLNCNKLV